MKKLLIIAACVPFAGCASVVNGINSVTGALSSPAATQAAANLKAGAAAIACAVNSADAVVQEVENSVTLPSKYAAVIVRDTQTVYVVSAAACAYFGGSNLGSVVIPATAPAPVVPVGTPS